MNSMDRLRRALDDIPVIDDPALVRQKSRDFFWYSPILKQQLRHCAADLVVCPRDEAEVVRVAAACARARVPLTVRGAGTGNYGQAVPLSGGVVLDMTAIDAVQWQRPGLVRTGPGARLIDLDAAMRPNGWELRMHPSTKRTATIGGFVAGGSGGVGSIAWGGLRETGNVVAARVVTAEETPRVLELRGAEVGAVNHAYGTTGIITALEMPLAPAWPWIDIVVAYEDFTACLQAAHALARADGVVKKLVTLIAAPIAAHFHTLGEAAPSGHHLLLAIIAEPSLEACRLLLGRGAITSSVPSQEGPGRTPLYEYTWNHTTLQVLKAERSVTYLQSLLPADRLEQLVLQLREEYGDEVQPHLEFIRVGGRVTASGLPIVRFSTPERLGEIIARHEALGISIANPHVVTLEDGAGHKRVEAGQLAFKRGTDPFGLLNPGKMRSYVPASASPA